MGFHTGSHVNRRRLGRIVKPRFIMQGGSVFQCVEVRPGTNSEFFEEMWLMVICLSFWHIWTRRYKFVFQRQKLLCGEVMLNIWFELVAWLRGRYDSIQGDSNKAAMASSKFLLKWGGSPMMIKSLTGPK